MVDRILRVCPSAIQFERSRRDEYMEDESQALEVGDTASASSALEAPINDAESSQQPFTVSYSCL